MTAGARLVVAIRMADTGSDALSAAGLSVPCKNQDTPPNELDKHTEYFINSSKNVPLLPECRIQLNILHKNKQVTSRKRICINVRTLDVDRKIF